MTVKLTKRKEKSLLGLIDKILQKEVLSIQFLAKILGTLEAALPGVQYGRIYTWSLHKVKNNSLKLSKGNYEGSCSLTTDARNELIWWKELPSAFNKINRSLPTVTIFSDACPNGWGVAYGEFSTGGQWLPHEAQLHSNILEITAALHALKIYFSNLINTAVHLRIDNMVAVACINKRWT